ncbi:glycosyltransferase family 2 protein [Candidatus Wolfebacteria bacterium]|nr:glycosyltransferase family 2 protein [Candidatus Wolfebacteria bacterium]
MKLPVSLIVLTYNEELNIENCLKNIFDWADEIFIVDSFSTDKTLEIAKKYNCKIVQHKFENQAQQFNWALDNLEIKNEWILRLDADEYLTEELKEEITFSLNPLTPLRSRAEGLRFRLGFGEKEISSSTEVNGYFIKRRVYFMGRWIKYGGYYPTWILRLFKNGKARSEQRAMDEHLILLEGKAEKLKNDFVDDNKKDLTWWIEKHNNYASREASEVFSGSYGRGWKKYYYRLPMFFRACLYFCYRYFIRLGFLDGKEGLIFHFLQGFWYRFLVDAKIYEHKKYKFD